MKDRLSRLLPDGAVASLRKLGRLRFARKEAVARAAGWRLRTHGADWIRFVVLGAEVDRFSYAIANAEQLARTVSEALDVPIEHVRGYMSEAELAPDLTRGLFRRLRFRFDVARTPPLGRRAAWYAVVRATKPKLVLETGVGDGHGSLVLLAALRRNGDEGHPGKLLSVDPLPAAGWLVPAELRAGWEWVNGRSPRALPGAIARRQVDLLVTSAGDDAEREREEHRLVLNEATEPVVLLAVDARSPGALAATAAERGVDVHTVLDEPVRHPSPGTALALARIAPPALA